MKVADSRPMIFLPEIIIAAVLTNVGGEGGFLPVIGYLLLLIGLGNFSYFLYKLIIKKKINIIISIIFGLFIFFLVLGTYGIIMNSFGLK